MVQISKERLDELRVLLEEKHGRTFTDSEVFEAGHTLAGLAEIVYEVTMEDMKRAKKLKENPKGFHLEGRYSCRLCHAGVADNETWWDKLGVKCLLCQQAYWDGVIPSFVFQNSDSYYSMWELKKYFGLHPQAVRKMIKEDSVQARAILNQAGKVHEYIVLKKENPRLLWYQRHHRLMSYNCQCPNPDCDYCLRVICLQKDCPRHTLENKRKPREAVIAKLEQRKSDSLARAGNLKLDNYVRESNQQSADEESRHIKILTKSLSPDG
jgi:hypothetical protein